jgi:hypothetical protein
MTVGNEAAEARRLPGTAEVMGTRISGTDNDRLDAKIVSN